MYDMWQHMQRLTIDWQAIIRTEYDVNNKQLDSYHIPIHLKTVNLKKKDFLSPATHSTLFEHSFSYKTNKIK